MSFLSRLLSRFRQDGGFGGNLAPRGEVSFVVVRKNPPPPTLKGRLFGPLRRMLWPLLSSPRRHAPPRG